MRAQRATLCEIEVSDPASPFDTCILQERNTNLYQMISSALCKTNRNPFAKKSLALKLKQAQRDHCCIDIVNRKSQASSTQNKRTSNIDTLKRQITYLEREELKWDKFPRDEQENQNPSLASEGSTLEKAEFEMHYVNRIEEGSQPVALKAFRNTFKANFHTCDQQRPLTTNDKRIFRNLNQTHKKSAKYGTLQQEDSERTPISKTIHSHLLVNSPFRKYTLRTKRNRSCTAHIDGLEGRQCVRKSFLADTVFD